MVSTQNGHNLLAGFALNLITLLTLEVAVKLARFIPRNRRVWWQLSMMMTQFRFSTGACELLDC